MPSIASMRLARVAAGLFALTAACSAHAFADDDARRAILELRETVKTLQSSQIQLATEISNLKEANRRLTGRIEELSNSLKVEQRNSRSIYESLDKRVGVFEPQTVTIDGKSVTVSPEEKRDYDAAVLLLQDGKFKEAEAAFKRFTTDYRGSAYRADALFWLGTSAFAAEHYKTAISAQNQLLREYPKSSRAADAMMLVASSQAASGSITASKSTLQKIIKTYPNTEVAAEARNRLKQLQ